MRARSVAVVVTLLLAACSGGDDEPTASTATSGDTEASTSSTSSPSTTATPADEEAPDFAVLEALAADDLQGRDNGSPGSADDRELLVAELAAIAEPVPGGDGYRHAFDGGTNLLGVVPGTSSSAGTVVLGAHYDGLGLDCPTSVPGDDVCNGAGDNAAGVAAVLEIGRRLAASPPTRTVVLALWDAEEDGLLGAGAFVGAPPFPLTDVVAYLNWDIQGVNLLPSLASTTIVVGAETGGDVLTSVVAAAADASPLDEAPLSLLFGQGRSDHAPFAAAGVPVVFFTDANSPCYHTSQDDLAALDLDKLAAQIDLGEAVARDLASSDDRPTFVPDAPVAAYADAEAMQAVVTRARPDLDRFSPADQATIEAFVAALDAMLADGEAAFDDADIGTLLGGSATLVDLLTEGDCESFVG